MKKSYPLTYALIPAASEDTAGSRIRVHSLGRTLLRLGHKVEIGLSPDADVIFVQERVTFEILDFVRAAKARGCLVLYDVVDVGDALGYWVSRRLFYEMIQIADGVTTCTEGCRKELLHRYGCPAVRIIPDAVDYDPQGPIRLPLRTGSPFRILWFGAAANLSMFEKYIDTLLEVSDVELVVSTGADRIDAYSRKYPRISFQPWSKAGFVNLLQTCDLSCLVHDGSTVERAKSNNKMIASVIWGVPAIVSDTPAYTETAILAGVPYAVFHDKRELCAIIDRLRLVEARRQYLETAQPEIWPRYSPEAVAKIFVDIACFSRWRAGGSTAVQRPRAPSRGSLGWQNIRAVGYQFCYGIWCVRSSYHRWKTIFELVRECVKRFSRLITKSGRFC